VSPVALAKGDGVVFIYGQFFYHLPQLRWVLLLFQEERLRGHSYGSNIKGGR